jgi:hypothetical protein
MSKFKEKTISVLQLKSKWVKIMFTVSIFAVLIIIFFPTPKKEVMISMGAADSLAIRHKPIMDTVVYAKNINDSVRMIIKRIEPVPPPPPEASRSIASVEETTVAEKKPFDWKGTITWAIGAINGLVLVVLNIKNLLFKKTP